MITTCPWMAGSREGNRRWSKLSRIFGLLEAMFLRAGLRILGRLTRCPWSLSLENERSCRMWTFSTQSLSSTRGVGSTHVLNILGGLTLGKLGVFLVGFFSISWIIPVDLGYFWSYHTYLSVSWKFWGCMQLFGTLQAGVSLWPDPLWHIRISSSPGNTVFLPTSSLMCGEWTQTHFKVATHMTMMTVISEAWETTESCDKWYKQQLIPQESNRLGQTLSHLVAVWLWKSDFSYPSNCLPMLVPEFLPWGLNFMPIEVAFSSNFWDQEDFPWSDTWQMVYMDSLLTWKIPCSGSGLFITSGEAMLLPSGKYLA